MSGKRRSPWTRTAQDSHIFTLRLSTAFVMFCVSNSELDPAIHSQAPGGQELLYSPALHLLIRCSETGMLNKASAKGNGCEHEVPSMSLFTGSPRCGTYSTEAKALCAASAGHWMTKCLKIGKMLPDLSEAEEHSLEERRGKEGHTPLIHAFSVCSITHCSS